VLAFGRRYTSSSPSRRAERVRILGLLYWPAPVDPQQVGAGARTRPGEQTGIAHRTQCRLEARLGGSRAASGDILRVNGAGALL